FAVLGDDSADGTLRVLELRGGVEEGAAPVPLEPELADDFVTDRGYQLSPLQAFRDERLRPLDQVFVGAFQIADDQVLLAREVAVEGGKRHLAGGDDAIDTD